MAMIFTAFFLIYLVMDGHLTGSLSSWTLFSEKWSWCVAQVSFKLRIFLLQSPQGWVIGLCHHAQAGFSVPVLLATS